MLRSDKFEPATDVVCSKEAVGSTKESTKGTGWKKRMEGEGAVSRESISDAVLLWLLSLWPLKLHFKNCSMRCGWMEDGCSCISDWVCQHPSKSAQFSVSVVVFLVMSSDWVFLSHCHRARQLSAVRCIRCLIVFHDGRAFVPNL